MWDPCLAPGRRALLLAGALAPLAPALAGEQASAAIALFGGAADRIEGSGKVIDEPRSITGFNRVIVQGPLQVRIKAADDDRVVVHADDNIAPLIETVVQGGALVIGLRPGASSDAHEGAGPRESTKAPRGGPARLGRRARRSRRGRWVRGSAAGLRRDRERFGAASAISSPCANFPATSIKNWGGGFAQT